MKKIVPFLIFYCISFSIHASLFLSEFDDIDLFITNGLILDGLGHPAYSADLVVVDSEIVFIGKTSFSEDDLKGRVRTTIDAKQRFVTPGFIDLHSHGSPLEASEFENFMAMGITTISLGQDGDSPELLDLNGWLRQISDKGIGVNLAMFVGHGTLRNLSGINLTIIPTPDKLKQMLQLLDDTLKYTFGMSTGLEYNPGLNAQADEMLELAKVVGRNDRLIMSHLRNEDDDQLEGALTELLQQGEFARVHVSHIKSVYGKGAIRAEKI